MLSIKVSFGKQAAVGWFKGSRQNVFKASLFSNKPTLIGLAKTEFLGSLFVNSRMTSSKNRFVQKLILFRLILVFCFFFFLPFSCFVVFIKTNIECFIAIHVLGVTSFCYKMMNTTRNQCENCINC